MIERHKNLYTSIIFGLLCVLAALFLVPIALVFINSFKSRLYVSSAPFALPFGEMGVGLENYINGLTASGFLLLHTARRCFLFFHSPTLVRQWLSFSALSA